MSTNKPRSTKAVININSDRVTSAPVESPPVEKTYSTKAILNENGQRVTPITKRPASQRVEAPPCTACRSANTFIYATRQIARYCKCRRCGHSFSIGPSVVPVDDIQTR